MSFDRNAPPYHFAVTPEVESRCPFILDDKQITVNSFIPTRTRSKDTGYDVRCAELNGMDLIPGCYFKMKLGFRMFAPNGWWLSLSPRSGTFLNTNIHALYGIIDESFENEMTFVGQYVPDANKLLPNSKRIKVVFGQRIAQVIPCPRWEMPTHRITNEELDTMYRERSDPRGMGGFGSSGRA